MYDFNKTENRVLDFWKKDKTFEKSLEKTKGGKSFVFFDGPPTANGRPGIHHFLGRAFKDLYGRYKTMRGFYVLRRAGWDTHGLPVEIEVEKQLGFKSKKDIENYGIAEFNKKCRESVWQYKKDWENMVHRMGHWIDMDDAYITYSPKYMETLWWIIKQIWDKKLLYKAHRVVPFCTRCGTPLSSHEVAQGYQLVKERSVYLKFKVKNWPYRMVSGATSVMKAHSMGDVFILAWTTTPWTLPGNVALAIGKNIEYVVARKDGEDLILAKDLLAQVLPEGEIIMEVKGSDLIGIEYESLFDIPELRSEKSYKVYDADFVSTTDGTGVVHTAVMYGVDDYNLGFKIGLPTIHTVDEQGKFKEIVGDNLAGMYVKDKKAEAIIIEKLEKENKLLKTEDYEHDYPFCWRCNSPLLYYAKDSWFISMSSINEKMLANNDQINWQPEHVGKGRFGEWIKESKDWAFSRERYWATPLPIWECADSKCDNRRVIGSIEEMEKDSIGSGNEYYILRHGLSERQEQTKMIIGCHLEHDKYPLTEEGRGMVKKSARELKDLGGVDYIFSSPFLRTKETAEIVSKELGVDVVIDERLREIEWGMQTEGKSISEFPGDWGNDFNKKHYDGESWNDERERIASFMKEADAKYKNKKILIVSHGDPLRMIRAAAEGIGENEIYDRGEEMEPRWAELIKLDWRNIPRNDLGELDLHRPFVDRVELKCDKCGQSMKKIPDLIDVWFDSGAMPFAQWHYPFENEKTFDGQFPAEFITEGTDQTRGWFYTLLAISTLLGRGEPFKNVISYAHVLDEKGKKMSKSKGNIVLPFDIIEKYGADAPRWYFYTVNAPGEYKLFSAKELQMRSQGFFSTLQNCLRFYELYKEGSRGSIKASDDALNRWVISRLNKTIKDVTERLDAYDPTGAARSIEKFSGDDFSNWWLRRSRKKDDVLELLKHILIEISKLSAPFVPFIAEDTFQALNGEEKSVHLEDWPRVDESVIDEELETAMAEAREAVAAGLASRKQNQIKVRQPLKSVTINRIKEFDADIENLIKDELNVKEIRYTKGDTISLDLEITSELRDEGYAREMIRQIQDMRKEMKY
ncbi:MAG: Isoleucine-tRNA ligase, partial [Candidatus Yanofskybacteria bacterium GW2011_GWE1_40_10]